MDRRKQIRYCRCGTHLASDNAGLLCSACQRNSGVNLSTVPSVSPEFWTTDRMRDAFASRHIGKIVYAYRIHPSHGADAALAGGAHPYQAVEPGEVSPSHRRDVLALSGLALTGKLSAVLGHELDMIHMTIDRGTTSAERTAYLERTARDLGVRVVTVEDKRDLISPALGTLRAVRTLLEQRQPTPQQVQLVQTSAMLSAVMGEILFNTGQFGKACEWYKTAEHAARDAGDRYLMDIALAGQSYLPTYSDDPRGVLALLAPRLESNPRPSPAIAWLWGFKARAHATLGEPDDFRRSIERAHECLECSPTELITPGIFSRLPSNLAFYEATGAVALNQTDIAVSAADRTFSLCDPRDVDQALARLERANALAQSGEVSEGCRIARDVLLDPGTYHGVPVRTYAARFDNLIRGIQSPETREWRQVLADAHSRN